MRGHNVLNFLQVYLTKQKSPRGILTKFHKIRTIPVERVELYVLPAIYMHTIHFNKDWV